MISTERASALWWRYSSPVRWLAATVLLLLAVVSTIVEEDPPSTQRATVAATDIASGAIIRSVDLSTAADSLGLATLPAGKVAGEIARGPISAGEPITASRLAPGRAVNLPPDEVAFPLVMPNSHVSGLLMSGDHIDVLATAGPSESTEAQLVAANVEVLAVPKPNEQRIGGAGDVDSVVLIAASQSQSIALAGLRRPGAISIAIR